MKGWVKDYRIDQAHWIHPLQEGRAFTKYEAWKDLIKMVNHKDNKFMLGNELVIVKRGSKITSLRQLSERWKWSKNKVDNFLKLLQKDEMVHVCKQHGRRTVVEIVNYEVWQGKDEDEYANEDDKKDSEGTARGQSGDSEGTAKDLNKNDKNDKNEKEGISISAEIENFRSRYDADMLSLIDEYMSFIAETRTSKKIADSIRLKIYKYFEKYSFARVEYAMRTHMGKPEHSKAKEEYTFGIIRNTSDEEAIRRLSSLKTKQSKTQVWNPEEFLAGLREGD